jgi:hypothetical protein
LFGRGRKGQREETEGKKSNGDGWNGALGGRGLEEGELRRVVRYLVLSCEAEDELESATRRKSRNWSDEARTW